MSYPKFTIYEFISEINWIIIHHSLTADGKTVNWQAIRRYHTIDLGWIDVGYHFGLELIGDDVEILAGRPIHTKGAHCKQGGRNHDSIGICCIGNYDTHSISEKMLAKLGDLCTSLCFTFNLTADKIKGHTEYAPYKSCPGHQFPMTKLRSIVSQQLGS